MPLKPWILFVFMLNVVCGKVAVVGSSNRMEFGKSREASLSYSDVDNSMRFMTNDTDRLVIEDGGAVRLYSEGTESDHLVTKDYVDNLSKAPFNAVFTEFDQYQLVVREAAVLNTLAMQSTQNNLSGDDWGVSIIEMDVSTGATVTKWSSPNSNRGAGTFDTTYSNLGIPLVFGKLYKLRHAFPTAAPTLVYAYVSE